MSETITANDLITSRAVANLATHHWARKVAYTGHEPNVQGYIQTLTWMVKGSVAIDNLAISIFPDSMAFAVAAQITKQWIPDKTEDALRHAVDDAVSQLPGAPGFPQVRIVTQQQIDTAMRVVDAACLQYERTKGWGGGYQADENGTNDRGAYEHAARETKSAIYGFSLDIMKPQANQSWGAVAFLPTTGIDFAGFAPPSRGAGRAPENNPTRSPA